MNNILMNAPMALATQQGIKTQTRRMVDIPTNNMYLQSNEYGYAKFRFDENIDSASPFCVKYPYKIGQVLWVREPARVINNITEEEILLVKYKSDGAKDYIGIPERFLQKDDYPKWIEKKQGIPNGCIREMARTFIRVTNIRVERLNEISEEDAELEGIAFLRDIPDADETLTAKQLFYCLWEGINGNGSFDNRWVWVLEFELISKEEAI